MIMEMELEESVPNTHDEKLFRWNVLIARADGDVFWLDQFQYKKKRKKKRRLR